MTPDEARRLLERDPADTALLFDFDGTLAPIVDDPAAAIAAPGAIDVLVGLSRRYARVAAVSGRPRSFLVSQLPELIDLSGLYGLETRIAGAERDHPEAESWRAVVAAVAGEAEAALPDGVTVEPKGLSMTVHFRRRPEHEQTVATWASEVGGRTGLEVRAAKASFELHPPVESDKGTSVVELAGDCHTVAYFGDDLGDLPAFAALGRLALDGRSTVGVAVGGVELPDAVAQAADLVVADPTELVELLQTLALPDS